MGKGFSEALTGATDLQTALTRLGEDPATVQFRDIPEILKKGIAECAATIE